MRNAKKKKVMYSKETISKSYWLGNLIAERDKIWNQISLIKDPKERQYEFTRFRMSSLCQQMIHELTQIVDSLRQSEEAHHAKREKEKG